LPDADVIVRDVAGAVGLAEGATGVRAVLDALVRLEPVSTRQLSRAAGLPVPIVASICGELRKRRVVADERPAQLTVAGRAYFAIASGLTSALSHHFRYSASTFAASALLFCASRLRARPYSDQPLLG